MLISSRQWTVLFDTIFLPRCLRDADTVDAAMAFLPPVASFSLLEGASYYLVSGRASFPLGADLRVQRSRCRTQRRFLPSPFLCDPLSSFFFPSRSALPGRAAFLNRFDSCHVPVRMTLLFWRTYPPLPPLPSATMHLSALSFSGLVFLGGLVYGR